MTRKVLVVVIGVAALVGLARPVAAQQYPPTSGGAEVTVTVGVGVEGEGLNQGGGGNGVLGNGLDQGGGNGSGGDSSLARTGLDAAPLVALGAGLVATGAFAVLSTRRRTRARLGAAS